MHHYYRWVDLAIALLPSLLFGIMSLLLGGFATDQRRQNVAVLIGAGLVSLACSLMMGGAWSPRATIWGALAGLMWAGGQVLMLRAYNYWGVGLTMPVTTALQLVLNAVLGIILFSEWRAPGAMPLGVTSLIFIMVAAAACSWQERSGPGPDAASRRLGFLATAASSALYGSYASMLRLVRVSPGEALGPMGLGLLVGSVLVAFILPRPVPLRGPRILPGIIAGGVWAVGNAALLRSTRAVGVASGFTLSQLGFVIATIGAMTILGERKTPAETRTTLVGIVVAVAGLILMGAAAARE